VKAPESDECPIVVDYSEVLDAKEGSASAESNDLVRQLGSHEEHWLHFDSPLLV